jgi:hypothetical protein
MKTTKKLWLTVEVEVAAPAAEDPDAAGGGIRTSGRGCTMDDPGPNVRRGTRAIE